MGTSVALGQTPVELHASDLDLGEFYFILYLAELHFLFILFILTAEFSPDGEILEQVIETTMCLWHQNINIKKKKNMTGIVQVLLKRSFDIIHTLASLP